MKSLNMIFFQTVFIMFNCFKMNVFAMFYMVQVALDYLRI